MRTLVADDGSWECYWTIFLDGGQITVEGPFHDVSNSTLAITGGTGKFQGAAGQMELGHRDSENKEYDFIYHLL